MIWIILYVAIVIFNAGALFAATQNDPHYNSQCHADCYREDMGVAWGLAIAGPFALPAAIFATGFLQYGWRLK